MRELTRRQEEALRFIQRTLRAEGRTPTYRRIARHMGVDVRSAFQHVAALERKGVLERSGRSIELLGDHRVPDGVPVLGRVAAGSPILAEENLEGYIDLRMRAEDTFVLRVSGDSMTGAGINDGDMVLARRQDTVETGEIAVVVIGDEATVKRVRFRGRRIVLEPANRRHRPMEFDRDGDGFRIAGKVLMARRMV